MQQRVSPLPSALMPYIRWVTILVATLLQILLFRWLNVTVGTIGAAFVLLPVLLTGLLLGVRDSLLAALMAWPLHAVLYAQAGIPLLEAAGRFAPRMALISFLVPAAGFMGDLVRRTRAQTQALDQERAKLRESEARLHLLLEQVPAILYTTDQNLTITSHTGAGLQALGVKPSQLTGVTLYEYLRTNNPKAPMIAMHLHALDGRPSERLFSWEGRSYQVRTEPLRNSQGLITGTVGLAVDVSGVAEVKEALRQSEQRFRVAFDHAYIGMSLVGLDGQLLQVNRSLSEMLGYPQAELLLTDWELLIHPSEKEQCRSLVRALRDGELQAGQHEIRLRHRLGHEVWGQMSVSLTCDAQNQPSSLVVQLQDVTDRKQYEAQLLFLASHDSLTGLYNRHRFREELQQVLQGPDGAEHGVVLFVDLDGFKAVNDRIGHEAADEVLKELAGLMRQAARKQDLLARLGGDEFVFWLPGAVLPEAQEVAEDLLNRLRSHLIPAGNETLKVTASIGIARFPDDGTTPEELLAHADFAMYEAKENGRGKVRSFASATVRRGLKEQQSAWEHRIREALAEDRFVLVAQPILAVRSGDISHYELLLRLQGADGELISPATFLDVAERVGLIYEVDRWVIRQALRLLSQYEAQGRPVRFTVNLSGKSLASPTLLPYLQEELLASGADLTRLVFEITETAAIYDQERAYQFVQQVQALGGQFALDDFGAGFASFHQLKRLAVQYIKIDGGLVRNLPSELEAQHIVRAICDMARGLGKETVAEFVENAETAAILQACGIDYLQGYHVGRPGPLPL